MAASNAAMHPGLRANVERRKLFDRLFVLLGMAILFAALLTLAILFLDLVRDGAARFNWDFVSSFPSRKAERAGILSAWVGTSLVMLVTLVVAVPVGVALWHLSALVLQATPGQRLWRLRLVDQQGRRPAALRLVVRAIVQGVGVLAVFAGPAWALLIDGRRRGPGDIIAGTVAVRAASVVAIAGPRA